MRMRTIALCSLALWVASGCGNRQGGADREFATLRDAYLAKYEPLYREQAVAWWDANITGSDSLFARKSEIDKRLVDLHSDRETFAVLKRLHEAHSVRDSLEQRELDVMYRTCLPQQADPALLKRIVDLENEVEQRFNVFRGTVDGRSLSENDIREIIATSKDSHQVEAAWKAYMAVGAENADRLRELVKLRNDVARGLGYRDWFALSLTVQDIDENELMALFDELDTLTREPFAQAKAQLDRDRAARFGIDVAALRPWHYGDLFFQQAPTASDSLDIDALFEGKDVVELARKYYAGIGLPADDILARSDLFEKPGKSPHAFCSDMDHAGDIRVLANLRADATSMGTILHELGHGVYSKGCRADIPFLLKDAPNALTTEGMAELFEYFAKNEEWLRDVAGVPTERAAAIGRATRESQRIGHLMFARWTQVMLRFEKEMYSNPDTDLGATWWNLKKEYQLLTPPESTDRPDYAAKIHVVTAPVYYHSYMMGELFAAQVVHALATQVLGMSEAQALTTSFYPHPEAGAYLDEKVFGPGSTMDWRTLVRHATGEPLGARAFAAEIAETPSS